uniref:Putative ovule protein n=1 Tax=Solanum chacoense TaxID=4108 RepID=A0A0V0GI31_SOLCH
MSSSSIPLNLLRAKSCNSPRLSVAQKFNAFTQDSTSFRLTILKKCLFHQKDRRFKILKEDLADICGSI